MKSQNVFFVLLFSFSFIESSFRCDYKYYKKIDAWVKYSTQPLNWFDARLQCLSEGATLISPITTEIREVMESLVHNKYYRIFTGVHSVFSKGDYYTVEGVPISNLSINWDGKEPKIYGNHSCLSLHPYKRFETFSCEEPRPFVCIRYGNEEMTFLECGTHDEEYQFSRETRKCYKFHTVPRNFSRAFFICSAEGGHLAILNSKTESEVLADLFKKYPAADQVGLHGKDVAFVGFHAWDSWREWRTIHDQTLSEAGFSEFADGEPNNASLGEECGTIYREGTLNDYDCQKPIAFICEKNPHYPRICRD